MTSFGPFQLALIYTFFSLSIYHNIYLLVPFYINCLLTSWTPWSLRTSFQSHLIPGSPGNSGLTILTSDRVPANSFLILLKALSSAFSRPGLPESLSAAKINSEGSKDCTRGERESRFPERGHGEWRENCSRIFLTWLMASSMNPLFTPL